jgi:hypothetical protein
VTFAATTTASFLRGSEMDEYGDEVESVTPYITGIPIAIAVRSVTTFAPATGEPRAVRQYIGRVNPAFIIEEGDRLIDERTGQLYIIDETSYNTGIAQIKSCRMELRRI